MQTTYDEPGYIKLVRHLGVVTGTLIVLALAGLLLRVLFDGFDRQTLLTIAVLACTALLPAVWLGSRMTENIIRRWNDGSPAPAAPAMPPIGMTPAPEPPPANPRAMQPLDVTEAEAREFLASLGS